MNEREKNELRRKRIVEPKKKENIIGARKKRSTESPFSNQDHFWIQTKIVKKL